jgi:hypothetical protein
VHERAEKRCLQTRPKSGLGTSISRKKTDNAEYRRVRGSDSATGVCVDCGARRLRIFVVGGGLLALRCTYPKALPTSEGLLSFGLTKAPRPPEATSEGFSGQRNKTGAPSMQSVARIAGQGSTGDNRLRAA